jgi:hypothetical protein
MRFDELLYSFIEEERNKNTWKVLLPNDAILDEFYLSAKEHIYATNPNGMIIIDNVLQEKKNDYFELTTKSSQPENRKSQIANYENDITKCSGKNCEMKHKCWRYTSPDNPHWQSYSDFQPVNGKCDNFWELQ